MEDLKKSGSDSEVSSNSSWSVLEDRESIDSIPFDRNFPEKSAENIEDVSSFEVCANVDVIKNENTVENIQPIDLFSSDSTSVESNVSETSLHEIIKEKSATDFKGKSSITLDEFLEGRTIVGNNTQDNRNNNLVDMFRNDANKRKRKPKKNRAESFGLLTVIGAVLAVTGISFVCLLSTNNKTVTSEVIEQVKTNFVRVQDLRDSPQLEVLSDKNMLKVVDSGGMLKEAAEANGSVKEMHSFLNKNEKCETLKKLDLTRGAKVSENTHMKYNAPLSYEEFLKKYDITKNNTELEDEIRPSDYEISKFTENDFLLTENLTDVLPKSLKSKLNSDDIVIKPSIAINVKYEETPNKKENILANDNLKHKDKKLKPATKNRKCKIYSNPSLKVGTSSEEKLGKDPAEAPKDGSTKSSEETSNINFINPIQNRIACNIVQDILLLNMTSRLKKHLYQKEKKLKSEKSGNKTDRKSKGCTKSEPHKESNTEKPARSKFAKFVKEKIIKKQHRNNDTNIKLFDELPFHESGKKLEENVQPNTEKNTQSSRKGNNDGKYQIRSTTTMHSLNEKLEQLKRKQYEYIDKVKSQREQRRILLKNMKLKQQRALSALIESKKAKMQQFQNQGSKSEIFKPGTAAPSWSDNSSSIKQNRLRSVQSIGTFCDSNLNHRNRCTNPPILSSIQVCSTNEAYEKSKETRKCPAIDCLGQDQNSKFLTSDSSDYDSDEKETATNKNFCRKNYWKLCEEQIQKRRKIYERMETCWAKRDDYLSKRMEILKNIENNLKKVDSKVNEHGERILKSMINEAITTKQDNSARLLPNGSSSEASVTPSFPQSRFIIAPKQSLPDKLQGEFGLCIPENVNSNASEHLYNTMFGKKHFLDYAPSPCHSYQSKELSKQNPRTTCRQKIIRREY